MAASYIAVPRDLSRIKSKVMFNLTKRQLICFSIAVVFGLPAFFLLKSIGTVTFAAGGMMIIMMPFFFLAMYEKNGRPLEVILGHFIESSYIRPRKRPYKTDNKYEAYARYKEAEDEILCLYMYADAMREDMKTKGGVTSLDQLF